MTPVSAQPRDRVVERMGEIEELLDAGHPPEKVFERFAHPSRDWPAWTAIALKLPDRARPENLHARGWQLRRVPADLVVRKFGILLGKSRKMPARETLLLLRKLNETLNSTPERAITADSLRVAREGLESLFKVRAPSARTAHFAAAGVLFSERHHPLTREQRKRAAKTLFDSLFDFTKVTDPDLNHFDRTQLEMQDYLAEEAVPLIARSESGRAMLVKHLLTPIPRYSKKVDDWERFVRHVRVRDQIRKALDAYRHDYADKPEVLAAIDKYKEPVIPLRKTGTG